MLKSLEKISRDPRAREVVDETKPWDDGYWVYLKPGFCCDPETHTVHEWTIARLRESMRRITPCNCEQCRRG